MEDGSRPGIRGMEREITVLERAHAGSSGNVEETMDRRRWREMKNCGEWMDQVKGISGQVKAMEKNGTRFGNSRSGNTTGHFFVTSLYVLSTIKRSSPFAIPDPSCHHYNKLFVSDTVPDPDISALRLSPVALVHFCLGRIQSTVEQY
jgi:hypothetical protein